MMRLAGQISVSLDVETFVEAGNHQKVLEEFLGALQERYPDAALTIKQRRERPKLMLAPDPRAAVSIERYRSRT
jgi:hypothetical protein